MNTSLRIPRAAAWAALALGLAACGGGDGADSPGGGTVANPPPKITRAQWESVQLGTKRDVVIDRFGSPAGSASISGKAPTLGYTTPRYDSSATLTFDEDTGELNTKSWNQSTTPNSAVDLSDFRPLRNGMTQAQVEQRLGTPHSRTDTISRTVTYSGAKPGTLHRCIHYRFTPNPAYAATVCFDESGKLFYKNSDVLERHN